MRLTHDWRRILRRAWSIRLALLAAACSALEVLVLNLEFAFPRGVFAGLAGLVTLLAAVSRIIAQPRSFPDEKANP